MTAPRFSLIHNGDSAAFIEIVGEIDGNPARLAWKGGLFYGVTKYINGVENELREIDSRCQLGASITLHGSRLLVREGVRSRFNGLLAFVALSRPFTVIEEVRTNCAETEQWIPLLLKH